MRHVSCDMRKNNNMVFNALLMTHDGKYNWLLIAMQVSMEVRYGQNKGKKGDGPLDS